MHSQSEKTYHIVTLGCQMNKSDSERIDGVFRGMGMQPAASQDTADVVLINSCSVRQSAEDRIFGFNKKFSDIKKIRPDVIVCVTGCMPGRDKDGALQKKLDAVDLYFPTADMARLPKMLSELDPSFRSDEDVQAHYLSLRPEYTNPFQAFVSIQTGCNHFCTYCVVPFSRGLEVNRPLKDILEEVTALALAGCREATLLGQIVNHYIAPDPQYFSKENPYHESDFAKLLWEINQMDGIDRVHWTAPHPLYMTDEVIDALTLPKQINFLHIPVQSGNDVILKKMNRRHDRAYYIDLIKKIRLKKPDIAIGTDIIVGFCGEDEAAFQDTVDLYRECDFDISYHAQYSVRSGTVAWRAFTDDVSKEEKKRRWEVLQQGMEEITLRKNQQYIHKTVSVLVDTWKDGWCMGNSREMKRVRFKGDASLVGTVQDTQIFKAQEWMLWGKMDIEY